MTKPSYGLPRTQVRLAESRVYWNSRGWQLFLNNDSWLTAMIRCPVTKGTGSWWTGFSVIVHTAVGHKALWKQSLIMQWVLYFWFLYTFTNTLPIFPTEATQVLFIFMHPSPPFFKISWLYHAVCWIPVPQIAITPVAPAVEVWSLNH